MVQVQKVLIIAATNFITAILVANVCYFYQSNYEEMPMDPKDDLNEKKGGNKNNNPLLISEEDRDDLSIDLILRHRTRCEAWPISIDGLPLDPSFMQIDDGSNPLCMSSTKLLRDTFALAFPLWKVRHSMIKKNFGTATTTSKSKKFKTKSINCDQWPPATMITPIKLHVNNPMDRFMMDCWHERYGAPFLIFPAQPPHSSGFVTALTLQHGIARLAKKYACNDNDNIDEDDDFGQNCVLPETFRITDNRTECESFFSMIQKNPPLPAKTIQRQQKQNQQNDEDEEEDDDDGGVQRWIKKNVALTTTTTPSNNNNNKNINMPQQGGQPLLPQQQQQQQQPLPTRAVSIVRDIDEELIKPFGNCKMGAQKKIIVQRYMKSYLIDDGYAFHIRTFLLYKLGSRQQQDSNNNNNKNKGNTPSSAFFDPPQAWFIKVGNIHLCSERYAKINDPELGDYAVLCSMDMWQDNPRLKKKKQQQEQQQHQHNKKKKKNKQQQQQQQQQPLEEMPTRPFPSHLENYLSHGDMNNLMKRIEHLMSKLSKLITSYHENELHQFDFYGETSWIYFGVDILIDSELRPWLLQLDTCPENPMAGDRKDDWKRNPFISMLRIIFSHYRREVLSQLEYNEDSCSLDSNMKDIVKRVY